MTPIELLTGQMESHLCGPDAAGRLGVPVHRDVVEPLLRLREAASAAGFELAILSGFRSFARQLSIWNRKADGELGVLDDEGRPLDRAGMSDAELAAAILRWSALPGASRHHWGTDLDVYDAAAVPPGYEVELIPAEVDPGGMFGPLHEWLDDRIEAGDACGFVRPYDTDRGGVAPERWHLSYVPLSAGFARELTADRLRATLEGADMRLKDTVLGQLPMLYERFVANVNPALR